MTLAMTTIEELRKRHGQLSDQLAELRSQWADASEEARAADTKWREALDAGEDAALPAERRRLTAAAATELAEQAGHVEMRLGEVEQELRNKEPHVQLDRDLTAHAEQVAAYKTEVLPTLLPVFQQSLDLLVRAAVELHEGVRDAARHADTINATADTLRRRATDLQRSEPVEDVDWETGLTAALRGGALWPLFLTVAQTRNHPLGAVRSCVALGRVLDDPSHLVHELGGLLQVHDRYVP